MLTIQAMFGIPNFKTFGEFCSACCCYCWCTPCVATQEYRQIMALLNRGTVESKQGPLAANVVGQPVATVGIPVQQPGNAAKLVV
jgi:hypothetical protein